MTGTELEVAQGNALALDQQQAFWNDHQLAALRQLGVDSATNGDLAVFHHVCQRTGLDPFARQIYMIERQGKQTIQTGIDGYRLVARRAVDHTKESLSITSAQWCGPDGAWRDVWLDDAPPAAARVLVKRGTGEFTAIALWREYVQTKRNGDITSMWASRPAGQLAKCAEALALRKAFPQDLSGIYVDAELDRADVVQGEVVQQGGGLGAALANQRSGPDDAVTDNPPPSETPSGSESPLLNTSSKLAKAMYATIRDAGITKDETPGLYQQVTGRVVTSSKELTDDEARAVLDHIKDILEQPFPPEDEPVDAEVVES